MLAGLPPGGFNGDFAHMGPDQLKALGQLMLAMPASVARTAEALHVRSFAAGPRHCAAGLTPHRWLPLYRVALNSAQPRARVRQAGHSPQPSPSRAARRARLRSSCASRSHDLEHPELVAIAQSAPSCEAAAERRSRTPDSPFRSGSSPPARRLSRPGSPDIRPRRSSRRRRPTVSMPRGRRRRRRDRGRLCCARARTTRAGRAARRRRCRFPSRRRPSMAGLVRLASASRANASTGSTTCSTPPRRRRGGALELDAVALAVVERQGVHRLVAAQRVVEAGGRVLPAREANDRRAGAHGAYELEAVTAIPPRGLNSTVTVIADRVERRHQIVADPGREVLVEDALLAERLQVQLQALRLDRPLAGPVLDRDRRPVGLAGDRAAAGELAAVERDHLRRIVDRERLDAAVGLRIGVPSLVS